MHHSQLSKVFLLPQCTSRQSLLMTVPEALQITVSASACLLGMNLLGLQRAASPTASQLKACSGMTRQARMGSWRVTPAKPLP